MVRASSEPVVIGVGASPAVVVDGAAAEGASTASCAPRIRVRLALILAVITLGLAGSLVTLGAVGSSYPTLISPGLLALSFGLRHALDADHIAAIDNVTRKLVRDGRQPLLVGLFFSLGHSSVVCIICVVLAATSDTIFNAVPELQEYGSFFGACISSFVLLVYGSYNAVTAVGILKAWRRARARGRAAEPTKPPADVASDAVEPTQVTHAHEDGTSHTHLVAVVARPARDGGADETIGCVSRTPCCRALFATIDAPWKMCPVGFLFGLGFDTATEVGLLALAIAVPARGDGVPWGATLVLPLVFTGGMVFLDTLNGLLMAYSYGWASVDRALQLWFNLTLTATSAAIALAIGILVLLGLLQSELSLEGAGWEHVAAAGDRSDVVGGAAVGFFGVAIGASALYVRYGLVRAGDRPPDAHTAAERA
jgi:high-affinity nickel-transport protein